MSKLKWKESGDGKYAKITIGALELSCSIWHTGNHKLRYLAQVSFLNQMNARFGGLKRSMRSCKQEAIEIAREMLEDHYVAVKAEMVNFEMEP